MNRDFSRRLVRLVLGAYWGGLTLLLLAPNPLALFGLGHSGLHVPNRGVHFSFFCVLGLLAMFARPRRLAPGWTLAILLAYGLTVETLQVFVPPRTVEFLDYLENITGVLLGAALWWAGQRWFGGADGPKG